MMCQRSLSPSLSVRVRVDDEKVSVEGYGGQCLLGLLWSNLARLPGPPLLHLLETAASLITDDGSMSTYYCAL